MRILGKAVTVGFVSVYILVTGALAQRTPGALQPVDSLITATARLEPDRTVTVDIQNRGAETVVAWTADIVEHRPAGAPIRYFYSHDYLQAHPQAPTRGIGRQGSKSYKLPLQGPRSELPASVEIIPTAVVLESNVAFGNESAVAAIFKRRDDDRQGFEEAKQLVLALRASKPALSANDLLAEVAALRSAHLTAVSADHIAEDMALLLRSRATASDAFTIALEAVESNRERAAKGRLRAVR